MYKKLVQKLIDAESVNEVLSVGHEIDDAFQRESITFKDHEQLYSLLNKMYNYIAAL